MPDINELGLPPDEILEPIDYEAPEPGSFPPSLKPGTYTFLFKLEEDPLDTVEITLEDGITKRKFLQIQHIAKTTVQEPNPEFNGETVDREVELRFQRVNFYKHSKMANSSAGDMIRAMDLRLTGALTPQLIVNELRAIEERRSYQAEVGWRVYCKADEIEIATNTRKKRIKAGEQVAWPKDKDGHYCEMAECPKCHSKMYGQAEIVRYKLPHSENGNGNG